MACEDKKDRIWPVTGMAVHSAVEAMYNKRMWEDPAVLGNRKELEWKMFGVADLVFAERSKEISACKQFEVREAIEASHQSIRIYLDEMVKHHLLSSDSEAETEMKAQIGKSSVHGRIDVIVRRNDTGVTVIDLKVSSDSKYINHDQLRFYALLHKLVVGKVPDRVGFVLLRPPPMGMAAVDQTVWVSCSEDDVSSIATRVMLAQRHIEAGLFQPNPRSGACKYCKHWSVCGYRKAKNRRVFKPKTDVVEIPDGPPTIFTFGE